MSQEQLRVKRRKLGARSSMAIGSSRRGVLLLVVLSMLVLFMLIGTAFLMSSSQQKTSAVASGKKDRVGSLATKKLDEAVLNLIRGSDNPHSVLRGQDLLSDL